MTIDKFGTHISNKYSKENYFAYCYIPLQVKDFQKSFYLSNGSKVITYRINELTNTWIFPLPSGTVVTTKLFHFSIKFVLNNILLDSLEGITLLKGDTILVVRSSESSKTGNGIVELILKTPVSNDDYE